LPKSLPMARLHLSVTAMIASRIRALAIAMNILAQFGT
jgi:hypothetical protein